MFKKLFNLFFKAKPEFQSERTEVTSTSITPTVTSATTDNAVNQDDEATSKVLAEVQLASMSMERLEWLFYDFLLGPSTSTDTISALEKKILVKVNEVLQDPAKALQGFVKDLTKFSPIYFKVFGERIWRHSDDTANICREFARQRGLDQETAFLIGLVHDLGKILVFKLMVDAFKANHPDEQLQSLVMKKLLQNKSMLLSYRIAQEWSLPSVVLRAIADLANQKSKQPTSLFGQILIEANFTSECNLALEFGLFTQAEYDAVMGG